MPNWCANTLRITAKTDQARALLPDIAARFGSQAKGESAFQLIKPMPPKLEGTLSPGDSPNWYDWRISNWGTKWSEGEAFHKALEGDTLTVSFETAWAPPEGIYRALVELGFDVIATYAEQGMGFAGWWQNGEDYTFDLELTERDWDDSTDAFAVRFEGTPITEDLYPPGFGG